MFFTINSEKKIGYKELTDADLGLGQTSNQTHIGLYAKDGMLSFMEDDDFSNAILIYNRYCNILPCDFDRIENQDGSFRSPKIRLGTDGQITVVRKIREFAHIHPERKYYLVWFGLDNDELLFWLFDDTSNDLKIINEVFPKINTVYDEKQANFNKLINYLELQIENLSVSLQAELELIGQTTAKSNKFRGVDIDKAQAKFKENGRLGENLINHYLEKLKGEGKISSFIWENKSKESYKPFDFVIKPTLLEEKYVDVKSTSYQFNQPAFFSDGEVEFISYLTRKNYAVYRVYSINANSKFRICDDCYDYMKDLNVKITNFKNKIQEVNSAVRQLNLIVNPNNDVFKSISSEISI